jgi:radical SAM superfamily enzyme YgiQ (UPF0313 family)
MSKFVFVSDTTLSHEYSNFPLLDFLPCAPSRTVPGPVYKFLKGSPPPSIDGRAARNAPYALRKLESALLAENPREDVLVAHEDRVQNCIDEDTEVIGVYTMDPLGIAPLTVSYSVLFDDPSKPWVRIEFERLIARLNAARKGTKAKLVVGGPGVWELSMMPEMMDELGIDLAFQGEADDIINELLEDIVSGSFGGGGYFEGFQSFDSGFHKTWVSHDKFITRSNGTRQFPSLEDIPLIRGPTIKGLVEIMRGCGIGCDFCEVTLRPLRYYSEEMVKKEVAVNAAAGCDHAWLHTDEIFGFQHGPHFVPNEEAILGVFRAAMSVKGIAHSNPTHGRISVPGAYPDLLKKVTAIARAGPDHWVGVQVGLETGSERLALIHMPNKTLPLRIGPDGSWQQIVMEGLRGMNRAYWRPAFTVQVGQMAETPEDNWETVSMVNRMSAMTIDGRPSEFTATPMQNVPLGLIKSKGFSSRMLGESQLAVYYACYRHLMKITMRDSFSVSNGGVLRRAMVSSVLDLGSLGLLHYIEGICKKRGLDLEKVKRHGIPASGEVTSLVAQ